MLMTNTDFFTYKDNFAKTAHISSIPIIESNLAYMPKVTIAIPTYKRAELLKEAIYSAINQTDFYQYDIIVVDNNSDRGCETERLIKSIKEPKLSYYKNTENLGMVGNLNRLYSIAKGKYVVELHDDDVLYSDYLAVLMRFIEQNKEKYDAIFSDVVIYNMIKSKILPERIKVKRQFFYDLRVNDFLWGNIGGSSHIFKKEPFMKLGGYDCDFYPADDLAFNIRFTYFNKVCKLEGYPLTIYRIFNNSSTETETLLGWASVGIKLNKSILKLFKNRLLKYLWERCVNVNTYKLLISNKKLFSNQEILVEEVLRSLDIKIKYSDFIIYNSLLINYIISKKLRRIKLKI